MVSLLTILILGLTFASNNANDRLEWHSEDISADMMQDASSSDDISHDCKTILPINHADLKKNPILGRYKSVKSKFVKYNHAYGIPVFGVADFKDDSMLRACYLVRYLFAGNQWLRKYAKNAKTYMAGNRGGWCCPPQMGNQGLSCSCEYMLHGQTNKYPFLSQETPAHEMAHWFLNLLRKMAKLKLLKIPDFQDDEYRKYNATKFLIKNPKDTFWDFLLNSYYQDKARKSTKIPGNFPIHHYFIYTGQDKYMIYGSWERLRVNNKNLYAIMKEIWQCDNDYITPCQDANYGFTKGLNQVMNIAKIDPNDPQKMICRMDLDKPEIDKVDPIAMPTGDYVQKHRRYEKQSLTKCYKVIWKGGWGYWKTLKTGVVEKKLEGVRDDKEYEYAWWLRKCCAKTAKFSFIK